jgi:mannose-6-phosphate isomerase-like protein (cupin superfamily)
VSADEEASIALFCDDAPSTTYMGVGAGGPIRWTRLISRTSLSGDLDSIEYGRIAPGAYVAEHVHQRTEEIYFVTRGRSYLHVNGARSLSLLGAGDLVLTPVGGQHATSPLGGEGLDFVVVEIAPPRSRTRTPEVGVTIVNLFEEDTVDLSRYFDGQWRTAAYRQIDQGRCDTLVAADCEHFVFVLSGAGTAMTSSATLNLAPGRGFMLHRPGNVTLRSQSKLGYFHVSLVWDLS